VYEKLSTIVFSPISLIPPAAVTLDNVTENTKVQSLSSRKRKPGTSKAKSKVVGKEETSPNNKRKFPDEESDSKGKTRNKTRKV